MDEVDVDGGRVGRDRSPADGVGVGRVPDGVLGGRGDGDGLRNGDEGGEGDGSVARHLGVLGRRGVAEWKGFSFCRSQRTSESTRRRRLK